MKNKFSLVYYKIKKSIETEPTFLHHKNQRHENKYHRDP